MLNEEEEDTRTFPNDPLIEYFVKTVGQGRGEVDLEYVNGPGVPDSFKQQYEKRAELLLYNAAKKKASIVAVWFQIFISCYL